MLDIVSHPTPKHVAFDVHIALQSFIYAEGNIVQMSNALDTFNGLGDPFGAAKFAIYVTQTLIGDGFMVSTLLICLGLC